jgi:hypothetical protein
MSNYSQTTDFSAKDSLATGNASKVIKGSEVDTEFSAIATAIASKRDSTTSDIPSGTMMLFVRTSAPSGWTLSTTWNNVVPIVKSSVTDDGTPDTGGNWTISSTELKSTFPSTAFTGGLPNHYHGAGNFTVTIPNSVNNAEDTAGNAAAVRAMNVAVAGNTGNPSSANVSTTVTSTNVAPSSGTLTTGNWRPAYVEIIACSKD